MSDFPTDKNVCLCCGGEVWRRVVPFRETPEKWQASLSLLEAIGYTREELLTKHREQVEYQLPGMIEWMMGQ